MISLVLFFLCKLRKNNDNIILSPLKKRQKSEYWIYLSASQKHFISLFIISIWLCYRN